MAREHATAQPRGRADNQGVRHVRLKLLVLAGLCLLPVLGGLQMGLSGQSWLPLGLYPAMSLVSLLLYWQDKQQARSQAWRTPEKVLHASELLGGWPGALLAQQLFRHKTRKLSFQLVCWAIVLVHQVFWIDHLFLGGRGFGLF
ncbi:MAG: DUF1294 domain-containing protein [Paucimonas sp.]|jgi:uncharacterized membrane protein YsdA (DUF1294 family)|uniref:DUF1294 domain-containing protein n=1 Tax=Pantoea sp. Cy-639 TaxID=2608360 RepID=UPI00141E1B1B|nr:DUF1294 domain-containing protein [Pantoea sp. Cy-639]MDR2308208.1 DUF1294 domain-containing protein [Paucimonas sp.]NIF19863.1 DUF1294 domain-containing protein [Pantoea sp. Cy-639]